MSFSCAIIFYDVWTLKVRTLCFARLKQVFLCIGCQVDKRLQKVKSWFVCVMVNTVSPLLHTASASLLF